MGRSPCCDKANVKKGPWSPEEDAKLKDFIEKYGTGGNWIALPQKAGLKRCGKSCRLRWLNYLRPNIRHGEFSDDEDRIICSLYATIGSRWSVIAAQLPGRTDNDIKNYWNTKLKKKLLNLYPSLQEKQTFFPSIPFQPPQLPSSHQFLNTSSSFYNFTPNFINNPNQLSSPLQPPENNLMSNNDNSFNHLGFPDDHHSMCNSPLMQEYYQSALMFGSTSCSSSEGGSTYNKDMHQKQQYQIKQENDQIALHDQVLGDQLQSHSFMIDHNPKEYMIKNNVSTPLHNDLEEVKQLNFMSSYLFNDGDENKTTHYQMGMCSYYY